MPRRPRGVKKKSGSNLSEDQAHYLLHGFCLDGQQPDYNHPRMGGVLPQDCPFATIEDMALAWDENRDHLMSQAKPGERPWADGEREAWQNLR